MAKQGKRVTDAQKSVDAERLYGLDEAVGIIKSNAKAKFDETVEMSINLGVDPRHADQQVRGMVALPNGTGKTVRVAVFARGDKADEASAAGADVVGAEELAEIVQGGTIDFDLAIATLLYLAITRRASIVSASTCARPRATLTSGCSTSPFGSILRTPTSRTRLSAPSCSSGHIETS